MPVGINLYVQNEKYSVSVRRSTSLSHQVRCHLINMGFSKSKIESCIIMYNSSKLKENDTAKQLHIKKNHDVEIYFPIPQHKASPALISHLRSQGLNPDKFVFVDENTACYLQT
jgi:hypothetical protein